MLELMTMRLARVARTSERSKSLLDLGFCSVSILVQPAKKIFPFFPLQDGKNADTGLGSTKLSGPMTAA